MTTLELFNKTEEALQTIGLTMDDFYSVSRDAEGLRVQGKYCEKIIKALTPERLSIDKYAGWIVAAIDADDIVIRITLTW